MITVDDTHSRGACDDIGQFFVPPIAAHGIFSHTGLRGVVPYTSGRRKTSRGQTAPWPVDRINKVWKHGGRRGLRRARHLAEIFKETPTKTGSVELLRKRPDRSFDPNVRACPRRLVVWLICLGDFDVHTAEAPGVKGFPSQTD